MLPASVERFFRTRMVANYDRVMEPFERHLFGAARARLVALAAGMVLDVGAGTGANFGYYESAVRRVIAFDPEPGMVERAAAKRAVGAVPIEIVSASAEALPFGDRTFDTVLATLVFCTIPDPSRALSEVHRVLRPGGRLLMLEHVRSGHAALAILQDLFTPVQRVIAAGCHLNRATRGLVERSDLVVTAARERFLESVVEIEAVRAG